VALARIVFLMALSCLFAAASFATEKAQLTEPLADAVLAPTAARFAWSPIAGAKYYIYVGSAVGAKNFVDSGELSATEFVARNLSSSDTIYVRLWTKVGGVWAFVDYTFQTGGPARLALPIRDSSGFIPLIAEFRWTSTPDATAYYLYVGRSVGAKDIVDSGETLALSRVVSGLPEGEHVYVRLWTKVSQQWSFNDYQFDVRPLRAKLVAPIPSTLEAEPKQTFKWLGVPDAEAYYLYVGRGQGASDVVNTGEVTGTRFEGPVLDGATDYYVRLHTKVGGVWRSRDYEFRTAPIAQMISPKLSIAGIVPGIKFSWSRVEGAAAYYLYIGSAPGQKDIVDTGELATTSFKPTSLPGGEMLHARLWTKYDGRWRYVDQPFTTAPVPSIIEPRPGAIGVDRNLVLRWSGVRDADVYRVQLGTTPHGSELFDSGPVVSTSLPISVPLLEAIYGRVWARSGGVWRQSAIVFSTAAAVAPTIFTEPPNLRAYSAESGFRWSGNPLAQSYRLLIGTRPGGNDVYDSGAIRSQRHFVSTLQPAATYHATLVTTYLSGATSSTNIEFVGAPAETTFASKFESVTEAAATVADMAANNFAAAGSLLETVTQLRNRFVANCDDYSNTLLALLRDMNVDVSARLVYTSLVPNAYDTHTLVEIQNTDAGRWVLVDPTFGVVPRRAFDGQPATSHEMSEYTRNRDWTAVSYDLLNTFSEERLRGYYIDYPLLFANIYDSATGEPIDGVESVIDLYRQSADIIESSAYGLAARCTGDSDVASVLVDGWIVDLACDGVDRQTLVLHVLQLQLADPESATQLLEPRRYVFD
jgi:hypothetical protein